MEKPKQHDNGQPHAHELERMSDEGGPEPETDYKHLDPVHDRFNGFRG